MRIGETLQTIGLFIAFDMLMLVVIGVFLVGFTPLIIISIATLITGLIVFAIGTIIEVVR